MPLIGSQRALPPEPNAVAQPHEIAGLAVNDQMNGRQASETFKVQASEGHVLASGGQTLGYGKRAIGERTAALAILEQEDRQKVMVAMKGQKFDDRVFGAFRSLETNSLKKPSADEQNYVFLNDQDEQLKGNIERYLKDVPEGDRHEVTKALEAFGKTSAAYEKAKAGDGSALGPVSHLFPKDKEAAVMAGQEPGVTESLLGRSAASSAVDQLLQTNTLSVEKYGKTPDGKTIGISVAADGAQVFSLSQQMHNGRMVEVPKFFQAPPDADGNRPNIYASHEVQKGLYDLEVLDYITGQVDRHPGNVVINPETLQVTGIDNDVAFPSISREEMMQSAHKPVNNLPRYMHSDTAAKICAIKPEELEAALRAIEHPDRPGQQVLSDQEIQGAVDRLKELQNHVTELAKQGRIVDQFDQATYDEALNHHMASVAADLAEVPGESLSEKMHANGAAWHNTSYIGSIEMAHQDCLPSVQKLGLNEIPDADVRMAPRDEDYCAMQAAVAECRQDLMANKEKIGDAAHAVSIQQAQNDLEALERKAADLTESVNKSLQPAAPGSFKAAVPPLILEQRIKERNDTLAAIKAKRAQLDGLLDKAVEPLKPEIAQRLGREKKANLEARIQEIDHELNALPNVRDPSPAQIQTVVRLSEERKVLEDKLKAVNASLEPAPKVNAGKVGEAIGRPRAGSMPAPKQTQGQLGNSTGAQSGFASRDPTAPKTWQAAKPSSGFRQ